MNLKIGYYAILREQRGLSGEVVDTQATTPLDLYEELQARHRFSLRQEHLRVVVNETFAAWDTALNEGDSVVYIPPVAGG